MPRRLVRRDLVWLALISGILVLLAVQVPFAARGFDRPSASPVMRLLEAPGLALGWGGVALVLVAAAYALVTWTRGKSPGQVLAVLGAVVFAVAIGAFAGALAATVERGGGKIGGALAHMLVDSLGRFPATLLLAVVSIPGLLLALAPLLLDSPNRPTKGGHTTDTLKRAWYPERRVMDDGSEVPMKFEGGDVGPVRYRDDAPVPAPPPPPPTVDAAERPGPAIPGVRFKDETESEGASPAPPSAEPHEGAAAEHPLPPGVRWSEGEPPPKTSAEAPAVATAVIETPPTSKATKKPKRAKPVDAVAPAAEPAPPPSAPTSAAAATPAPASAAGTLTYRGKLASSGMFEKPTPTATRGVKPPTPKPMPATAESYETALQSLFSSLPVDELPPARVPEPEPAQAPPEPPKDDPNQAALFGGKPAAKSAFAKPVPSKPAEPPKTVAKAPDVPAAKAPPAKAPLAKPAPTKAPSKRAATEDPLFLAAADAAVERGSASLVLLKRKLDVGYERAENLMTALVSAGIVGEMTASGSRPTLVTAQEWAKRRPSR